MAKERIPNEHSYSSCPFFPFMKERISIPPDKLIDLQYELLISIISHTGGRLREQAYDRIQLGKLHRCNWTETQERQSLPKDYKSNVSPQDLTTYQHCRKTASCAVGFTDHEKAKTVPTTFSNIQSPNPCTSSRLALPVRSYVPVTLSTKLTTTAPASTIANTVGPNRSSKPPCPLSRILLARQWKVTSA